MTDVRGFFENVVYHNVAQRRYTQQSPVMPDVWIEFGMHPGEALELLIVPDWHHTPAELASELRARLAKLSKDNPVIKDDPATPQSPRIAHNQNAVVATLSLAQLVHAVLPLSAWWQHEVAGVREAGDSDRLHEALGNPEALTSILTELLSRKEGEHGTTETVGPDTVWLARVVGLLALIAHPAGEEDDEQRLRRLQRLFEDHQRIAAALVALLAGMEPVDAEDLPLLYTVNRNRRSSMALTDSASAVKADATRRVFDVAGRHVRWAVIDSGIDARHVAFRRRETNGTPRAETFEKVAAKGRRLAGRATPAARHRNNSRVVATFDFVNIRDLLSAMPDDVDGLSRESFPVLRNADARKALRKLLQSRDDHMVDWEQLQPFIEIHHEDGYRAPVNRHGTHVAGIIGADWRRGDADAGLATPPSGEGGDLVGVSPEVELYDLRVLNDRGEGNEFAIMSALQFVRHLNNRKDFIAIHGVNLSFSIEHDVANYACGRTPVCEEAERLVGSGTTVVAAAGNSGRARYLTPTGAPDDGFRTVSITDPGNADAVITVGATHRRDPHTYGVSYFSSRGPTGDGRLKPDLVAPGEKILSTAPDDGIDRLDGTSMAAPHVSGAIALIMSRHPELMRQPARIKQILCATATDLGRERYFQGAGLLDVLRALESI